MLAYLLLLIAAMVFVLGVWIMKISTGDGAAGGFLVCIIGLALIFPLGTYYSDAVDDVGFMSQINNRIEMVETELGKLDAEIKATGVVNVSTVYPTITLNADSPVATLLHTRMAVANKLIDYKDSKLMRLAIIKANCIGPMSAARTLFIDGYCDVVE